MLLTASIPERNLKCNLKINQDSEGDGVGQGGLQEVGNVRLGSAIPRVLETG